MKPFERDDSEKRRKQERARKAKLARIMRGVPQTLAIDLLTLTVCWRYAESLLQNPHVKKYLMKYHPVELSKLETLLAELEEAKRFSPVWPVQNWKDN